MTTIEFCITLFLVLFTIVCGVYQLHSHRSLIKKYDFLRIVPVWTFFAPTPLSHDFHLMYRDILTDKKQKWIQIKMIKSKSLFTFIWHPERRLKKKLIAISNLIGLEIKKYKDIHGEIPSAKDLESTFPYKMCLDIIMNEPILKSGKNFRQFMIAKTKGTHIPSKPEIFFVSVFHQIQNND